MQDTTLGGYDHTRPLIIDPTFVYAGYLSGTGLDRGAGIAVDSSGAAYITGDTTSADFPVKVGPGLTYHSSYDAFVAKVSPDSKSLVYAGYIGGTGSEEGSAIAVDSSGAAYITGQTQSTPQKGFPVKGGPGLTYNGGYWDAFVAKVNPAGTGLVYAGYIGGTGADSGNGIAVDSSGAAYITGTTSSTAGFPVKGGPDLTFKGRGDAFVAKVNPAGTGLVYAGYIAGSNDFDSGSGIAVDPTGAAYITGTTHSIQAGYPVKGGPDLTYHGGSDAFVAKVNPVGTGLVYAGYIGGTGADSGNGIAVDSTEAAYITGSTTSTEASSPGKAGFPVKNGPDLTYNGGATVFEREMGDAFVAKVKPDGTGLLYASYIGGSGGDEGSGIAVDSSGAAYVTGSTTSTEASSAGKVGFPVKVGPDLTYNGGGIDAFVAKVSGPQQISVPNVMGRSTGDAATILDRAGFSVRQQPFTNSSCANVGKVLLQSPVAGTSVLEGSLVTISIGDRPPPPIHC